MVDHVKAGWSPALNVQLTLTYISETPSFLLALFFLFFLSTKLMLLMLFFAILSHLPSPNAIGL